MMASNGWQWVSSSSWGYSLCRWVLYGQSHLEIGSRLQFFLKISHPNTIFSRGFPGGRPSHHPFRKMGFSWDSCDFWLDDAMASSNRLEINRLREMMRSVDDLPPPMPLTKNQGWWAPTKAMNVGGSPPSNISISHLPTRWVNAWDPFGVSSSENGGTPSNGWFMGNAIEN